jgi:signal peptidase I
MISLRVVAVAGDQVDIREDGLYVNGYLQYEENIYEKTTRYEEGVDFPLTVGEGEVFVLGDSRENSTDSRIFGPVSVADTYGKTIMIIRRRNV